MKCINKRIIKQTNMKWGYPVESAVFLEFIAWLKLLFSVQTVKKKNKTLQMAKGEKEKQ